MVLESMATLPGEGHAAGRVLLARMYQEQAGETMPEIQLTQRGRPYFAGSPWHFSISHTKTRVFCALSERKIGIDAEPADRPIDLRLADKILSPMERAQYDRAADKRLALLTFWVLKEASAKYTGEGLKGYPNQTEFSLEDPRVTVRDGCLVAIVEE